MKQRKKGNKMTVNMYEKELMPYLNKISLGDSLEVMKSLPNNCVDTIMVDPPYFGIVSNDWDNQWENIPEFQAWCESLAYEYKRILKNNGSFYWFGDDKMVAYCQVVFDKYFSLLNSLVWRKSNAGTIKGVESFRSYAPITERCLFYEQSNSPVNKSGCDLMAADNKNPFAIYLTSEFNRLSVSNKEVAELFPSATGKLTGCVSNWLNGNNIITKEQYLKIRDYIGRDSLSMEYEELRGEYEELRRFWNARKDSYDVLDFPINQEKGRFHPTQKPIKLMRYLLERSTRKGAIVFDGFSGSGTTALACHDLGYDFICVEKDEEYHAASVKRLEEHQRQGMLF
jgi:site-specific DNA-methyltransferase (adenine-specific)